MGNQQDLLLMSMFVLGLRHGFDWDHLAALADISSVSSTRGFWLCFLYAAGHAAVVLALGLVAVHVGNRLPPGLDTVMEPLVGVTLVALGLWLIFPLWRSTGSKAAETPPAGELPRSISVSAALTTGIVHGIGAETPTQILALLAAASAAHGTRSLALVCIFVAGIFASNLILAAFFVKGFAFTQRRLWLNRGLGILTAVFSLAIGVAFLTRSAASLPPLSGA
ncbi:MAG: hypothetical protein U0105_07985 [Candidatus Obscuribacterales bacterium]